MLKSEKKTRHNVYLKVLHLQKSLRCFEPSIKPDGYVQVRLAAIPSPINMLNLQAAGWWPTIWARMVQAERHARGCADFAYCLKHARSMPRFSWTTVALCLKVRKAKFAADDLFKHASRDVLISTGRL